MIEKQFKKMIIVLTILILGIFIALVSTAKAEMDTDKRNPGTDKVDYTVCEDKQSWFEKSWCETVEFQKQGWEQSKKDLAKTKEDLSNLPDNTVKFINEAPTNVGNFIRNTGTGISNWAAKEWHSIKEYQSRTWNN